MLDTRLQERFTRGCTDAAFGYTAAAAAAYAAFADQVFDFWAGVLEPPRREPEAARPLWGRPMASMTPMMSAAPRRREPAPLPFAPFAWAYAPRQSTPMPDPFAGANAVFSAWLNLFPYATAQPAAWPMAFMLIASGVPRSVAWPTAEANAAALDAADAAAVSVQQVLASYRSDSGHAVSQTSWPPVHMMMFAALVPLNVGMMLANFRMA